jgi:hypothetical protein
MRKVPARTTIASLTTQPAVEQRAIAQTFRYKRFYLGCGAIVLSLSTLLVGLSVRNMYTSNSAQELEFHQKLLQAQLQELEQQTSQTQSLMTLNEKAQVAGFVKVEKVAHTGQDVVVEDSFISSAQ